MSDLTPLTLRLAPVIRLSDEDLLAFCRLNRGLRIERTAEGSLVVMAPVGGETSDRNAEITMQLRLWARRDGSGRVFDSSGGFLLPNGAMRSPDAAWVERAALQPLAAEERRRFLPLCPHFVLEIRSPSDQLSALEAKMVEYLDNGARLGWLIDPERRRVAIYRPGVAVEVLEAPVTVAADPELPGFVLELAEIWEPSW